MSPFLKSTIMSQYANSPVLLRLIDDLGDRIDPNADIEQFYDIVMNLHTAEGFGLDVWGRIVDVSRNVRTASVPYDLDDEAFRSLILIKAMINIVSATAPNINRIMKAVFGGRKCYFLIVGHMKAQYVFEFQLSDYEQYLIYDVGVLPRPCGVLIGLVDIVPEETFGFYGTEFQPFNQGAFYAR